MIRSIVSLFATRLAPAIVTALGVSIVMAGLLTYADPAVSRIAPTPSAVASAPPTSLPFPTLAPLPSLGPSGAPTDAPSADPSLDRVATRIVIPLLDIDLPIVGPPDEPNHYPYCNVAEYLPSLHQPGQAGTTYVYAHARDGMFGPILEASKVNNGRSMLGMLVQVYTSDDRLFVYEVTRVLRHQTSLEDAFRATEEQLMLQTSEGPRGTIPKTQVVARPLYDLAAPHADAHPTPKPVDCR